METSVPRFQLLKKEGIFKNGVKRGDMTSFSTKKNVAEENLFNHDVVGSARFGLFFQYFFFYTNIHPSFICWKIMEGF